MTEGFSSLIEHSTASGWALCVLVAAGLFAQWRIHAKQRPKMLELAMAGKAATETTQTKANDAVIDRLLGEVARMGERIEKLEHRVDELEDENRVVVAERDAALADVARLRAVNDGQGQVRQDAATFLAMERAQDAAGRAKP